MENVVVFPDPGALLSRPPPQPGQAVEIFVEEEPPCKDYHYSIRNPG